jgi:hypothetical protein
MNATTLDRASDGVGDVQHDRMKVIFVSGKAGATLPTRDVFKQGHRLIQVRRLVVEDPSLGRRYGTMGGIQLALCLSPASRDSQFNRLELPITFGAS